MNPGNWSDKGLVFWKWGRSYCCIWMWESLIHIDIHAHAMYDICVCVCVWYLCARMFWPTTVGHCSQYMWLKESQFPSLGHCQPFQTVHDNHPHDEGQPERIKADLKSSPQTPSFLTGSNLSCLLAYVSVCTLSSRPILYMCHIKRGFSEICLLCGLFDWHVHWPDTICTTLCLLLMVVITVV